MSHQIVFDFIAGSVTTEPIGGHRAQRTGHPAASPTAVRDVLSRGHLGNARAEDDRDAPP